MLFGISPNDVPCIFLNRNNHAENIGTTLTTQIFHVVTDTVYSCLISVSTTNLESKYIFLPFSASVFKVLFVRGVLWAELWSAGLQYMSFLLVPSRHKSTR